MIFCGERTDCVSAEVARACKLFDSKPVIIYDGLRLTSLSVFAHSWELNASMLHGSRKNVGIILSQGKS
jgi:hypothetical protein